MLRIFPALFAVGVILRGGLELVQKGELHVRYRRFALGLGLGAGALFLLSLGTDLDTQVWLDFVAKIRLHQAIVPYNHIGLSHVFAAGSITLWLVRGVFVLLFLLCIPRVDDAQAGILGGSLVFAFGLIGCYYYAFLLFYFLWAPWERVAPRALLLAGLLFLSASVVIDVLRALGASVPTLYWASSLGLLATFAVLFAQQLVLRPAVLAGEAG